MKAFGRLHGASGVGARELRRGRRPEALVVGGEERQPGERPHREAGRGAHAVERVVAVQRRVLAALVAQLDRHVLVARAHRERQPLGDVERVGDVDADVVLVGAHVHRGLEVLGLLDAHAVAPRRQVRLRLALGEARPVPVVRHAHRGLVAQAEDLALVRELERHAPVLRVGLRPPELALGLALELAVQRPAPPVHEPFRRALALPEVERAARGRQDPAVRLVVHARDLHVAVLGGAPVVAVEPVGGELEVVGQPLAPAQVEEVHQVLRLVRERVHGVPVPRQEALRRQRRCR